MTVKNINRCMYILKLYIENLNIIFLSRFPIFSISIASLMVRIGFIFGRFVRWIRNLFRVPCWCDALIRLNMFVLYSYYFYALELSQISSCWFVLYIIVYSHFMECCRHLGFRKGFCLWAFMYFITVRVTCFLSIRPILWITPFIKKLSWTIEKLSRMKNRR